MTASAGPLVVLAGGVGAARFLRGLIKVVPHGAATAIVNTGDDLRLHGLHISPDLDTITYTLGGGVHPEQGWGRAEETRLVTTELQQRYGHSGWFTLGDRDLATHLMRAGMLAEGATLSQATARIAEAWELPITLLPMTDDPVATIIETVDGRQLHFQRWWVGERAGPDVAAVRLSGADTATPAPGVLDALDAARFVLLCPSNPVVSIGTILQVPGIRDALADKVVVGISPIVGGNVVRGMADRLLPAVGAEVSAAGVATLYADFLDGWVIDEADRDAGDAIEALGMRVAVTDTMMHTPDIAASVAQTALELASTLLDPPDALLTTSDAVPELPSTPLDPERERS